MIVFKALVRILVLSFNPFQAVFLFFPGIAQGSVLATTLNNIHYGDIETKYLVSTYQTLESFFIRWVDDYFFVTTSLQLARRFLNDMNQNMPNYGANLNLDKLSVNFKISGQPSSFERCQGDWFSWCGYLFNLQTMECCYNYIQYIGKDWECRRLCVCLLHSQSLPIYCM